MITLGTRILTWVGNPWITNVQKPYQSQTNSQIIRKTLMSLFYFSPEKRMRSDWIDSKGKCLRRE